MDAIDGTQFFLTRKLWDVGNSAPYGHRGDVSTITETILFHGDEGRPSREAFLALSVQDQKSLAQFLKSYKSLRIPVSSNASGFSAKWLHRNETGYTFGQIKQRGVR